MHGQVGGGADGEGDDGGLDGMTSAVGGGVGGVVASASFLLQSHRGGLRVKYCCSLTRLNG